MTRPTLANVVSLVIIAQFDSLVNTGGRARWHRGAEEAYMRNENVL